MDGPQRSTGSKKRNLQGPQENTVKGTHRKTPQNCLETNIPATGTRETGLKYKQK